MTAAGKKLNQYSRFDQWNLAYDANGNLSKRGGQDFTYDYRNRMISAKESGSTVNFNYDALGRRIEKTGPQGTTRYYYAGDQVIEERNAAGQVTRQYVYGNGIDEVLRLDVYTGGTAVPYYFHANQIGSITAITDSDGNIVERVSYDTYGRPYFSDSEGNSLNSSSIGNTTLFQGREYDPETGLYHYRARAYDPIMGRFLQVDPLGYVDSMNLYQAFNMNPVNYLDPLGEGIVRIEVEKIVVDNKADIPGNTKKTGLGKTELSSFNHNYYISNRRKNGITFSTVEFDIVVKIQVYWTSKTEEKFTALHEMGHVSDIIGHILLSGIPILEKIEKKEYLDVFKLKRDVNNAIIKFGYVLLRAQLESAFMRDFVPNFVWSGLNFVSDLIKSLVCKMPSTESETVMIEF